ncbi:hypothetical protein L2E82_12787 [Cichorium intybus]|uniref:Uncharacterized protein n=1 Tax=Cichorium intybus TaxID=13427 RepID=A0ACB9GI65_CICIN|nr:hypothetical protein L2E82_12787 [Cichorium intybus]
MTLKQRSNYKGAKTITGLENRKLTGFLKISSVKKFKNTYNATLNLHRQRERRREALRTEKELETRPGRRIQVIPLFCCYSIITRRNIQDEHWPMMYSCLLILRIMMTRHS